MTILTSVRIHKITFGQIQLSPRFFFMVSVLVIFFLYCFALFVFGLCLVPNDACVSELSIFYCPFSFLQRLFIPIQRILVFQTVPSLRYMQFPVYGSLFLNNSLEYILVCSLKIQVFSKIYQTLIYQNINIYIQRLKNQSTGCWIDTV